MDFARLGTIFRAVRIKKRWRQVDVAVRARVARSTVSRLERGHGRELRLDELVRIAEALDISLKVVAAWRGGDLDRLLNVRHSALHESVARWLGSLSGWEMAPEVSYAIYGERGVIDVLAWHAATETLLMIELKTEIIDVNDLMGRADQRRRLAGDIARQRGWRPRVVAVWVLVADSSTNRRRVSRHASVLRAAFPNDARALERWVAQPAGEVAGLSFWSGASGESFSEPLAVTKRVRRPRQEAA